MNLDFGKNELIPGLGDKKEWLLTNGLGGFASSTIIGENTRRYHGLLFAALQPPVDRRLLVAKLDEDIFVNEQCYSLGTNRVKSGYAQEGFRHLVNFQRYPFPTYTYQVGGILVIKTVIMIHGQNRTVVHYRIVNQFQLDVKMHIYPLVNCRDFHHVTNVNDWPFHQTFANIRQVGIAPYEDSPQIYLASDRAQYTQSPSWYQDMYYSLEDYRGLSCYEDHFIPGHFSFSSRSSQEFSVTLSTAKISDFDYEEVFKVEDERNKMLLEQAGYADDFVQNLVLAADDFVVESISTGRKSIIAGYPWFNDWGRDAMIALPGLTLCTGRFQDAREILTNFAEHTKEGLIPNMFTDGDAEPLYNTVDASLWYFYAVQKYLEYTEDHSFVKEQLWETMQEIVKHYREGTRFGIRMDSDGLIIAGVPGLQLTWMDAKVGDWVVTPRQGKPVEINALWYNALVSMSHLAKNFGEDDHYNQLAAMVKRNFVTEFWNKEQLCLYDVIGDCGKDESIRPNQIIAISLPFSTLPSQKAQLVVKKVYEELYAIYGLRSLSVGEQGFRGHYGGDQYQRDGAYHQGTVWSWLLGHYVTAHRKAFGDSRESAWFLHSLLVLLKNHLRDHGVGTVSEIFDGEQPFTPRGCFAQAWGVAEYLRCYLEDSDLV